MKPSDKLTVELAGAKGMAHTCALIDGTGPLQPLTGPGGDPGGDIQKVGILAGVPANSIVTVACAVGPNAAQINAVSAAFAKVAKSPGVAAVQGFQDMVKGIDPSIATPLLVVVVAN